MSFVSVSVSPVPVPVCVSSDGYVSKQGIQYSQEQSCTFLKGFVPFQKWLNKNYAAFGTNMKHVHVLGIYPFSHTFLTHSSGINQVVPNPVGFACVEADIQIQGVQIPGFAFLRGDSVTILPILRATEDPTNEFVLVTSQHRVPVGNPATL